MVLEVSFIFIPLPPPSPTPPPPLPPHPPPLSCAHTGTPLTPLANLKMLIAAASSALDRERETEGAARRESAAARVDTVAEETTGRKMKSLAILCKK